MKAKKIQKRNYKIKESNERASKAERAERAERAGRGSRTAGNLRAVRADGSNGAGRSQRSERPDRSDRSERGESTGGSVRNIKKKRNVTGKQNNIRTITMEAVADSKKSGRHNNEIIGILLLSAGILLSLSIYTSNTTGVFGNILKNSLFGICGIPAYIVPPAVIIYGILLILKKETSDIKMRLIYAGMLVFLISGLIQAGYYIHKDFENLSLMNSIRKFYNDGNNLKGGGVAGGMLSLPFISAFQLPGAIIILTTLAIIDTILLTNISLYNFFRNIRRLFSAGKKMHIANEESESDSFDDKSWEPDFGMDSFGHNDEDFQEYGAKGKLLDFRIDNISHESRDKLKSTTEKNRDVLENKDDHFELIISDIKKPSGTDPDKKRFSRNNENRPADGAHAAEGSRENEIPGIHIADKQNIQYRMPSIDLLAKAAEDGKNVRTLKNTAIEGARKLEETLKSFGVEARVINVSRGPTVTRYELQPSPGVKVSRIVNLTDDISLNLAAEGVRLEAPIPGKAAIGIEVPNKEITPVLLREVIESPEFAKFPSKLAFAVGKDISGENIITDISRMPHLLIAGATGAGKSVCINCLILSLLFKAAPDEVKLLMIDPKVVELGNYNGIPHLLIPVVTDPKKAAGALNWAVQEMVNRYKFFAEKGAKDIKSYNAHLKEAGEKVLLPHIVIIIDELADLMMVAPNDVEDAICRLAQMARAAGMHLVIATQRPSVDVITGIIKANIPSRISFAVTSQVDSRTILDMAGAEKLIGKGDMLFYPVGKPKPVRLQGAYISEQEIESVVEFIKNQANAEYNNDILEEINNESEPVNNNAGDNDELLPQAIELVVDTGQASVSLIQRRFKVGYARAARIIDQMEARGVIGGYEGSKPRQVLISKQEYMEWQMKEE